MARITIASLAATIEAQNDQIAQLTTLVAKLAVTEPAKPAAKPKFMDSVHDARIARRADATRCAGAGLTKAERQALATEHADELLVAMKADGNRCGTTYKAVWDQIASAYKAAHPAE